MRLFVRSLLGGFYIGLAMLACLVVRNISPDWGNLLGALVFPIGILLVIYAKGALFTGVAGQFAERKIATRHGDTLAFDGRTFLRWLSDLGISLLGNVIGIAVLALLAQRQIGSIDVRVATPFWQLFGLGILCNIMVFLSLNSKNIPLQYIPIFAFVLLGFAHSIADISLMFWAWQFGWFIVPVLLGNLVGGSLFSLLYQEAAKHDPDCDCDACYDARYDACHCVSFDPWAPWEDPDASDEEYYKDEYDEEDYDGDEEGYNDDGDDEYYDDGDEEDDDEEEYCDPEEIAKKAGRTSEPSF
jgi:formate/nitrite transporter FocA (FNT family)